jgi:superfamily II DNA/RNA helicase
VDAVPLVVHFDPPADATDYVHRSGRTGRAGVDGTVVSLIGVESHAAAAQIQRTLSLPKGLTAPDIASLGGKSKGKAKAKTQSSQRSAIAAPVRASFPLERPPVLEVLARSGSRTAAQRGSSRSR